MKSRFFMYPSKTGHSVRDFRGLSLTKSNFIFIHKRKKHTFAINMNKYPLCYWWNV